MSKLPDPSKIQSFGLTFDLFLTIVVVLAIPVISSYGATLFFPLVQQIDPDGLFAWISLHHIIQLILTIIVMLILASGRLDLWGFNLNHFKRSLVFIMLFLVVFGAMEYVRLSNGNTSGPDYPLTQTNMLGQQGFQYLLSGLGEEPLFRGFVMVFLASSVTAKLDIGSFELPLTVLIATALFMLAHIDIDMRSLSATTIDIEQQMRALQLGLLYGVIFHHTRSLVAPIIIHGLSNGLQFTIGFYLIG